MATTVSTQRGPVGSGWGRAPRPQGAGEGPAPGSGQAEGSSGTGAAPHRVGPRVGGGPAPSGSSGGGGTQRSTLNPGQALGWWRLPGPALFLGFLSDTWGSGSRELGALPRSRRVLSSGPAYCVAAGERVQTGSGRLLGTRLQPGVRTGLGCVLTSSEVFITAS